MILPLIMSNTGDMKKNWLIWKQCFLDYMESNNYNKQPDEYKINVLRSLLGHEALRDPSVNHILNYRGHMHKFTTLTRVLERLDYFFSDMKNELVERYNFFTRFQQKDEPIETYILDLIEKAKTCNFGNLTNNIVRDKVIANIHSKELRSKLFHTLNLNLEKLIHICKEHEAQNKYNNVVEKTQTQTNALHSDEIALVEASNSKKVAKGKQNSNGKVNAKINVQTKANSKNDKSDTSSKAKTDSKMHNSGSNITSTACQENNANIGDKTKTTSKNDMSSNNIIGTINRRHSDTSNKAKTDSKMRNSGSNITSTACQENNANIGDKAKTNPKNSKSSKTKTDTKVDNSDSNITSTACQENNANIGDKTKTNSKNDMSSNNIIGTTNRRHSDNSNIAKTDSKMHNSGDKIKTDVKNGNYVSDMELVYGKNIKNINDKAKIDSKGMNSNPNMNTARRNSVSSGTQYRRNCRKCNEKHAERSCPAWGHKCENCGERNHFRNCCQMKPLKTTELHINMSSVENSLNPNHFQYNNQPQPIPPSNYVGNIEPCYLPSAPQFCETENELYPKLCHMSIVQASAPLKPEATVGNTEPKTAAAETKNHKNRSNSDTCSIS